MKTGRSLISLAQEVGRIQNSAKDYIADTRKLSMTDTGGLLLEIADQTISQGINPWAHQQIGSRLAIPKDYYDRMLESSPALLAHNVNHWFHKNPERRLVRTVDSKVRSFLSDRYRSLDNFDLMDAIIPTLRSIEGLSIESCELTETKLYIKAVAKRITKEIRKGDVVSIGVSISNSEVGAGSLAVDPFIFRYVCTNGMVARDFGTRKYHVGKGRGEQENDASIFYKDETRAADDKAFFLKIRDTVQGTLTETGLDRISKKLIETTERKIDADPVKVVERAAKRFTWTEKEQGQVLNNLVGSGDLTQYGLLNAVTRTSQDSVDYDRASELERQGGEVMNLTGDVWKGLVNV